MNCTEFESAVELAVETRLPVTSSVLEHAKTCESCRTTWLLHQRLESAIGAWRVALPPAALADAVLTELMVPADADDRSGVIGDVSDSEMIRALEFDRPKESNRRMGRMAGLALLSPVACLLVIVLFMNFITLGRSIQSFDDVASNDGRGVGKFTAVEPPPDVSSTFSDVLSVVRTEYGGVASNTKTAAIEVVNSIPPLAIASGRMDLTGADPSEPAPGRSWHPISSRVSVAMGFLWKAVPSDNQSN